MPGAFTMAQQAQNDFYKDDVELAMDYATAVNEEIKDLFAAGADVVQIDEPYLQARPEKAKQYGVRVLNRALKGITGTTAVHICFGYAAIIHQRPSAYSFLPELEAADVQQISIETAQSHLDCKVLAALSSKTILLGVLDLADMTVETPAIVADRIRRALGGPFSFLATNFYLREGGSSPPDQRMNNFLPGKTSYAPQWACRTPT